MKEITNMKNQQLIYELKRLTQENVLIWDYCASGEGLFGSFRDADFFEYKWHVIITELGLMIHHRQSKSSYELGVQRYGTNKNKLSKDEAAALSDLCAVAKASMKAHAARLEEAKLKQSRETLDIALFDMQNYKKTTPPIKPTWARWFRGLFFE